MSTIGNIIIVALTFLHVGIVITILFGWLFPEITIVYGLCLIGTALSWLLFKRCILVDIEVKIRKIFDLDIPDHKKSFTATFVNRLIGLPVLSDATVIVVGVVVMVISIPYWIYLNFL